MSIYLDIENKFKELYDGSDDNMLYLDLVNALSEEDRARWLEEVKLTFLLRPEYGSRPDFNEIAERAILEEFGDSA